MIKTDWQKFKEWDLQKQFPGYFNKTIFRIGFIILFIWVAVMVYSSWGQWDYVNYTCSESQCENPFYKCRNYTQSDNVVFNYMESRCIAKTDESLCSRGLCDKEFLSYGDSLGETPPYLVKNFYGFLFLDLILMFLINHIFYYYRRSKN